MAANPLKNVSLKDCRKFLIKSGCKNYRTTGGHEHWTKSDLKRPITIQTHIDPVPERIMKQIIIALGIDKNEFQQIIKDL